MATKNDITGDTIKTKNVSQQYRDNWERIFGNPREVALNELAAESQRLGLYDDNMEKSK